MPIRLAIGVNAPKYRYVCLSCRLEKSSYAAGRTARYQHTGPPANDGRESAQGSNSRLEQNHNESMSPSLIGDIIRRFISKPNEEDKENEGDSRTESLETNEVRLAKQSSLSNSFDLLVSSAVDSYGSPPLLARVHHSQRPTQKTARMFGSRSFSKNLLRDDVKICLLCRPARFPTPQN